MGKIQDAFTSTNPKMVELRMQMFRQAGMLLPQGQATVQGQMVPWTRQLPRYPVDNIIEPTSCTLQVPFGRAQRKKDVAMGVALPPESGAMYDVKPIPPDYAWVNMTTTNKDFDKDEIDIPTERGVQVHRRYYRHARAMEQERHCLGHADAGVTTLTPNGVSPE